MFFLFASDEPGNAKCPHSAAHRRPCDLWQNMIRMLKVPWTRNKRAWMWVAIAAVAFTSIARAEAGLQSARTYAHPVLDFLARSQSQNLAAHSGAFRFANPGSGRHANSRLRNAGPRRIDRDASGVVYRTGLAPHSAFCRIHPVLGPCARSASAFRALPASSAAARLIFLR